MLIYPFHLSWQLKTKPLLHYHLASLCFTVKNSISIIDDKTVFGILTQTSVPHQGRSAYPADFKNFNWFIRWNDFNNPSIWILAKQHRPFRYFTLHRLQFFGGQKEGFLEVFFLAGIRHIWINNFGFDLHFLKNIWDWLTWRDNDRESFFMRKPKCFRKIVGLEILKHSGRIPSCP